MLYPNLEAELKRRNITRRMIADDFEVSLSAVSDRLNGNSPVSMAFAKSIKARYEIDVPLEILFEVNPM
ncbi:MAG: helix-turn-helix transcriptional regulator [Clostridia bacterium]|nr:helix-turn-helix transcriptional regulator [Clostridia bacterium]